MKHNPLLFVVLLLAPLVARGAPILLYDGTDGVFPNQQGWAFLTDPLLFPTANQTSVADGVRLSSPVTSEMAGYFGLTLPQMPVLPATGGFVVTFSIQLIGESHVSDDRAGFSLHVLNDQAKGIELGFWEDRIWAQDDQPLFTHAEEVLFDTRQRVDYSLYFDAQSYSLEGNGTLLLQGDLRDYSAHTSPVYSNTNSIFMGDNTSSAAGEVEIYRVAVDLSPGTVSEPPLWALLMPLLPALWGRRKA